MSVGEHMRARVADRTARDLAFYEAMFGNLPVEPGQKLLNVGAGDSALGNELDGVQVIDVDYGYRILPPLYNFATDRQEEYKGIAIPAKADQIPLNDNEVDCTVVSHLFMHLNRTKVRHSIDELVRVTANDGRIFIGPIWDSDLVPPDTENEYVSFRDARYVDGWGRPLASLAITVPEDKEELSRLGVSELLADSRMFGNKPLWRNWPVLLSQALENLATGGTNRRYDPTGRTYALERVINKHVLGIELELEDQPD